MIRVLVVDDQEMYRVGLRAILESEPDIAVSGEAADGDEAISKAKSTLPDVVLMDVRMPNRNGIEATRAITGAPPGTPTPRVIILTTFDVDDYVFEALHAGASGFLLKDATPAEILGAVRVVAAGDALLAPTATRRLVEEFVARPRMATRPSSVLADLTERELEVFKLIASGASNTEIATTLFIAEQTVKSHVSRILAKLGVRDRVHAVVLGYETGIVTPGGGPVPR